MRSIFWMALACIVTGMSFNGECCSADSSAVPSIRVVAKVKDGLEIRVDLRKDVPGYPDILNDTLMDFGELVPSPLSPERSLVAESGIVAFVYVNSHQKPYTVYSNVWRSLSSGIEVLPDGAVTLNSACSNGDQPHGNACEGTAGYSGTAIGDHVIYRSGGKNRAGVVQAHYTVTDDPSLGATSYVPADQYGGTYESVLVITVVR